MVSDDELAAVLGHELSHVLAEHAREMINVSYIRRLLGIALLPMLVGAYFAPRLLLTATTSWVSAGLISMRLSRGREDEADYIGMLLMAEAGFDPRARKDSWQKLVNFKNSVGMGLWQPPNILSTHPSVIIKPLFVLGMPADTFSVHLKDQEK